MENKREKEFAVHLYPTVRVKVTGIKATSMKKAIEEAEKLDLHDILDNNRQQGNVETVAWDEGPNQFVLVDQVDDKGELIEKKSKWYDGVTGGPLIDGKTYAERRANSADLAVKFMTELLESVETLTGISEEHGAATLAEFLYLQNAILTKDLSGGKIDVEPGSPVLKIVSALPSSKEWLSYVDVLKESEAAPQGTSDPSNVLDCYVEVTGEASDHDDQSVAGFYCIQVTLKDAVSLVDLTEIDRAEIAEAVLDSFHESVGISVLDDFQITALLPNGESIEELDGDRTDDDGVVLKSSYMGAIDFETPAQERPRA